MKKVSLKVVARPVAAAFMALAFLVGGTGLSSASAWWWDHVIPTDPIEYVDAYEGCYNEALYDPTEGPWALLRCYWDYPEIDAMREKAKALQAGRV